MVNAVRPMQAAAPTARTVRPVECVVLLLVRVSLASRNSSSIPSIGNTIAPTYGREFLEFLGNIPHLRTFAGGPDMQGIRRPTVHVLSSIPGILDAMQTCGIPLCVIADPEAFVQNKFDAQRLSCESLEALGSAEILLTEPRVLGDLLAHHPTALPKVKWVQSTFAGVDGFLERSGWARRSDEPPPFVLTRFGGVFGPLMAEWVIGQIICRERGFDQMRRDQQNRVWRGSEVQTYRALSTLTIGVVGLGEIGSEIARVCHALGMSTVGLTRRPRTEEGREAWVQRYLTFRELPLLLQTCDYVCNVCPSTPATKGLLGAGVLAACATGNGGRGAVLINVGRGDACDEDSIVTALENGWIGGAILDVFEAEPLPTESRLWDMPNVVVSPHVSAVTFASDVAQVLQANYQRYTANEELRYVVNLRDGY